MAITSNSYTGNGATTLYSFTFPYLDESHVKVTLNGTPTTAYTFANATTIQFNTAPGAGVAIRIYRETDDSALEAVFSPGSSIRAADLNVDFDQLLYLGQESNNISEDATATANQALTNSNTAISTANSATSTANTALSNSTAAVNTANAASSAASSAVSTANTAASNASTALSTANTASSNATAAVNTANAASSTANTALSTANAASSTANSAANDASTALSQSNTAISTANAADSTANNALSVANGISATASTALANSNTAISTANAASSTANAASTTSNQAIILASQAISLGQKAFEDLYNSTLGSPGSKIIDLGSLATGCVSDYFAGENGGTANYNCAIGCSLINLGSL